MLEQISFKIFFFPIHTVSTNKKRECHLPSGMHSHLIVDYFILNKFSAYKKLASITVGYLDMETMNIVDTQMYIDGYQVKLVSDTSYGSLWEVGFTLKEF